MSRIENLPKQGQIPEGKKPPKGRFKSNPFSIKSLTLLKKMYIETTASSKVFSKQPEGSPPTQVGEDCKKKSHVLRFSEYSLKILFAKDLLKMLEKLSSGTQEYKNPSKDGLLLFNSKKGALSPDKAQKATGSKDLNSSSLTQKNNREEILSQIKKELDSLQKQLVQDSNLLKPREKSLKEVFNLLHREISSISSEIKEMPKIRMQILHSELVNIKSKINSELKNTKASSEKKEGSTFLSATKAEVERSSFEKLKILDTQKKFSRLITLYHSLLQLKQALIEGRNFGIFTGEVNLPSTQQRALLPFGIVYPFSSFKTSISLSKAKKKKFKELDEEEDESDENNLSNKKQKK